MRCHGIMLMTVLCTSRLEKNCLNKGDKDKAVRKTQMIKKGIHTDFEIRDGVGNRSP